MSFQVGHGRGDITTFFKGLVMLGYGNPRNDIRGIDERLTVRTFWIQNKESGKNLIYVNFELCFITQALSDALTQAIQHKFPHLNLKREDFIFSAQHTHSGPSGYTHYAMYNVPNQGFSPKVLEKILKGATTSITEAYNNLRDAKIFEKRGSIPADVKIAFNRSLKAYNKNPEVYPKLKKEEQNLGINREMLIWEFVDEHGAFGSINWFGVHPTNIVWTNHLLSPGNKGYASLFMEDFQRKKGRNDYVSIFAQANAGDVSPIYTPKFYEHWLPRPDQKMIRKSRENGRKQFVWASKFLEKKGTEVIGDIDSELVYADMSNIKIPVKYLPIKYKNKNISTSPACLGLAFIAGSEYAGINPILSQFCKLMIVGIKLFEYTTLLFRGKNYKNIISSKYRAQNPKHIFVECGDKRVLGTSRIMDMVIPGFIDPAIKYMKGMHKRINTFEHSWTQQILPVQITTIGNRAIASVPAETSTIAGKRIKEELEKILKAKGVHEVVVSSYSNSYCGYIVTPEEYTAQCYEGGHTVFGRWTLPAFQSVLATIANEMLKPKEDRQLDYKTRPPQFSDSELDKRTSDLGRVDNQLPEKEFLAS